MTMPKLPFSFPDFVKYPLQAVLFLLLLYFAYKEFDGKDECADLRAAGIVKDKRIETLEKKIDDYTWSIMVKDRAIKQLKFNKDSVSNENIN